jgi:DNA-binding transcriptional ArsR family regulator
LKTSTRFQQRRRAYRTIENPRAIEVLAYPLRQELVDTIEACGGEAAVSELAEQLGRPADGLYYHLRLLARAGLIAELAGRSANGRRERRYRIAVRGRGTLRLAYHPEQPRHARAVRTVVGGMLRIARRDFDKAIADREVVVDGPARELWAARGKGWVDSRQLAELNDLLARAMAILDGPRTRARDRLVSVCYVLAPVRAAPSRRRGTAKRR